MSARCLRPLLCLLLLVCAASASAMSVVFLNPGKSDEKFWVSVSQFMAAAAADLGIELEVLYAEREPTRVTDDARAVVARGKKPDYLIVVNEKQGADEILRLTANTGIKVFMLLSTLTERQAAAYGRPREKLAHWIGALTPNYEDAGYQMATALIAEGHKRRLKAADGKLHLIAISGDRTTPAATEREAGLRRALDEHREVVLEQLVHGEWNRARAREQAKFLFARYPDARLAWSANDQMAFGIIDAAGELGRAPGKDFLVCGLNNSRDAMQARIDGRFAALASGHFTAGGWALVMLYDYHQGKDFAGVGGSARQDRLFTLLDARQAARFLTLFGESAFTGINFRQFSRTHNPALRDYRFSLATLLD